MKNERRLKKRKKTIQFGELIMKSNHWIPNRHVIIIIKQDQNFLKREFFLADNKSKWKERKTEKNLSYASKVVCYVIFLIKLTLCNFEKLW